MRLGVLPVVALTGLPPFWLCQPLSWAVSVDLVVLRGVEPTSNGKGHQQRVASENRK